MPCSVSPLRCLLLVGTAVSLIAVPWVASQPPATKAPLPSSSAQARAEALVKKLYKGDYAEAKKNPSAAVELAATLLRESRATKDDTVLRFAGLCQARDLAAGAGDAAITLEAIAELVKHYPVKGLGMKSTSLAMAARTATSKEANLAVVEAALHTLDEALFEDDYNAARTLSEAAETAAARVKNLALYGRVDRRIQEIEAARQEFARVKKFADRLRENDADAEANYQVGRYRCLVSGNWERGLPLLVKGNNAPLKILAQKQLANPKEASAQARIGDDCEHLAEIEKGQARRNLQRRALHWYQRALPKLQGLTRVRVERALGELAQVFPLPGTQTSPEIVAQVRVINNAHPNGIQAVTISPDGKFILSAGVLDRTVRLWDATTGKELKQFLGHAGNVDCVAISPDGKYGASGCTAMQLRTWDLKTGMLARQFFGHNDYVRAVRFLPDGKRLLSAGDDNALRIWDLATGKQLQQLVAHGNFINGLSISKDGKRAATASNDQTVAVWDLVKMQEIRRFRYPNAVWAVALSPDGKRVVASAYLPDRTVRVWEVDSGKELRQLSHPSVVWSIAFSPDGKRVYTGSGQPPPPAFGKKDGPGMPPASSGPPDNYLRVWDVDSGKELRRLGGHTGLVRELAVSADGRLVVTCGNDNTIRIWGERK